MKFKEILTSGIGWLSQTPDRALDQAYKAALMIKNIETKHFKGRPVSQDYTDYSPNVHSYFLTEIDQYLATIKIKLNQFKMTNYFKRLSQSNAGVFAEAELTEIERIALEKLKFIDEICAKYEDKTITSITKRDGNYEFKKVETSAGQTGVLPRSILRTFTKIKQEIDPESTEAEEKVVTKFRKSRNKTAISVKFLLTLIIVPLLVHQVSKTFLVAPIIERYFLTENSPTMFLNRDIEEEAFEELKLFEENLRIKSLIGLIPSLTSKEIEEEVKQKAEEIVEKARNEGHNAIENIFADLFSLLSFAWIIAISKREIIVLKAFLDDVIYGLSDSAKAFLIILFTDIFVGYHSPHGWEIVLEGVSRHLGIPESRQFIFLFIATFPVILDTILKYWIFRYLNRISPSSVATYRNMNE
jgi:hypothetical protein